MKISFNLRAALACTAWAFAAAAGAQINTAHGPLKLIVGYPAGGSADVQARTLADKLAAELGTTVVVDNRTGAGGAIAADYVRTAPADGLTVLLANMHMMVMLPLTTKSVRYDPVKDFKPVGRIVSFYEGIAVPAELPARDVKQWLDIAAKDPKKANYGVPAPGSVSQFMGYRLGSDAKAGLVAAPYRGAAPLVQDLLGNQISAGIMPIADLVAHQQSGKLKVLAVNGAKRAALLPDVPTLKELGQPHFDNLEWTGLFVPAGTPRPIVDQLHAALGKALANKDVRERLLKLSSDPNPSTPEELSALIADDLKRWGPVVKASGFTSE
ncbi:MULTISPECIES: Bug family tripartite tricarboxylate transporter substrate binding protein [unclassified Variovorax]|uniref:Bug family tripartite tricarboxylate transporter substrate binding protein n=1 Tax=unclassified Variovorax TaxID=663243 RepID=UPI00177C16BF|nr:Bug family tripartite tricarboxylate transporter substrate binding protein [Variovorax sp. VRV01]MBD9663341.1 Bug family tripartite tricarboxylate transporter substrate binding protein [Variovorax sp. VRV01]